MNNSYSDFLNGDCSRDQYFKQFETPLSLQVGKIYVTEKYIIQHKIKIVFVDDKTALGIVVSDDNGGLSKGEYKLYHNNGINHGFLYRDVRPQYRLISEVLDTAS